MESFGWTAFFQELENVFNSCQFQIGTANERFVDYITQKLELGLENIKKIKEILEIAIEPETELEEVVRKYLELISTLQSCILWLLSYWDSYLEKSTEYQAGSLYSGSRGRPSFNIHRSQLEYLRQLNFSWTEIADLVGVSSMTIYRRRSEFGMLDDDALDIHTSDQELNEVLQQLRHDNPYSGETMMMGHLRALGVYVSRERVRLIIRRTDPLNVTLRWGLSITARRPYSVPGPNSLWHIDGHHKLIRWRFVTHCGIDGYSRVVVFLRCSTNNRASTVLHSFSDAVSRFGVPSRVRTYQGRENMLVAQFMLQNRGHGRGSIITGSSVHNQRIERLWRDLHRCVTQLYYRLFYYLEQRRLLDPVNEVHIFALHYVYLPRINKSLEAFKDGWNMHGIRTENNKSPLQLFNAGALRLQHSGLEAMDLFQTADEEYGVDDPNVLPQGDDESEDSHVEIPETRLNISEEVYQELCRNIDIAADDNDYGFDKYCAVVCFLTNH